MACPLQGSPGTNDRRVRRAFRGFTSLLPRKKEIARCVFILENRVALSRIARKLCFQRARVCVYARALYICLQLVLSCECYYHKLNTSWSKRRLGVADKPMTSGAAASEIINLLYEKRRCRNRNAVPTDLCGDNYRDRYLRDHLNSIQYPAVIHRSALAQVQCSHDQPRIR